MTKFFFPLHLIMIHQGSFLSDWEWLCLQDPSVAGLYNSPHWLHNIIRQARWCTKQWSPVFFTLYYSLAVCIMLHSNLYLRNECSCTVIVKAVRSGFSGCMHMLQIPSILSCTNSSEQNQPAYYNMPSDNGEAANFILCFFFFMISVQMHSLDVLYVHLKWVLRYQYQYYFFLFNCLLWEFSSVAFKHRKIYTLQSIFQWTT